MLPAGSPERPMAKAGGRLSQVLIKLLMRQAEVVAVETLAPRFRLITLEGEALKGVAWTPGQKIQVAMESAFTARTYTPIIWNAAAGRTCLLAYEPGHGPGSDWVRDVAPGDQCSVFGPRPSLDLRRIAGPIALFGDETSLGLAYTLAQAFPGERVTCVFEVDDVTATRQVLGHLDMRHAELFARQAHDAHLQDVEARLLHLVADSMSFILTGKAGTVQRLRLSLKSHAAPMTAVLTKAYWAPGKSGLD